MNCRHCKTSLTETFLNLGFAPPSNAYLTAADLSKPEKCFPLKIMVCNSCWLVQTEDYAAADELFDANYAYFSSTSSSWLAHAKTYSQKLTKELELNKNSFVIEVASNDGYLLKNFVASGIPCLGIEPTDSTAAAAEQLGVPVLREFFGEKLGKQLAIEGSQADLIVGNNVYAHVPDINDFTFGLKAALKPGGTITLEFPHLMELIKYNQFDTVYHEHFSYLSLLTVSKIFQSAGLRIYDVEKLTTHGGSLRIFGCHADDSETTSDSVKARLAKEKEFGLNSNKSYANFQRHAEQVKVNFLDFLTEKKRNGKNVMAYGAAAKGNTLLNFSGVDVELISGVFDNAQSKQFKFLPGSHIQILPPEQIEKFKPDYIIILPWNLRSEIEYQLSYVRKWGTKLVTIIPALEVF